MSYYISKDGHPVGPFQLAELSKQLIKEDTLIWEEGSENWIPAKEIEAVLPFIVKLPPPIPNSKSDLLEKKYDLSFQKESHLQSIGIVLLIISFILVLIINFIASVSQNSYRAEAIVFTSIISLLLRIWGVYNANISANRLNRDPMSWVVPAFFFPGITLIVLSTRHKLK